MDDSKLLLVKSEVLPEVFGKVVHAKHLLSCGVAKNVAEAAKLSGISRSAFYKYRDSVFYYSETATGSVISVTAILDDKAGVLSLFIGELCAMGANILTINQGMPSHGAAAVSVSFRSEAASRSTDGLLEALRKLDGVVSVNQVLGDA